MITIGLKRVQTVALWTMAQDALISQAEFFRILDQEGPTALLGRCADKGLLNPIKPARSGMDFERLRYQKYEVNNALFFTCSQNGPIKADIKNWKLSIEGDGVERPLSLNYDDLWKLPVTTVTRYLECDGEECPAVKSGLSRGGVDTGWGLAEWTGVRVSDLLKAAGMKPEAAAVRLVSIDNSSGERPIPMEKALEEDTLLAYIMNGEILPADHGFPLRAILPGWTGSANIKWITKIIVSTRPVSESEKKYFIKGQAVKSACCISRPAVLKIGHQEISGYAWSPFGKIAQVEVSLNGGRTFQQASLTGPNIEKAGTRWEFCFHAEPGKFAITTRATDDRGNIQIEVSAPNSHLLGVEPYPVVVPEAGGETYSCPTADRDTVTFSGCC